MPKECIPKPELGYVSCLEDGVETKHYYSEGPHSHKKQLGDKMESMLESIGVTKDRYKAAKLALGFPPTCDCDKRKEWLNKAGVWWKSRHINP
jgi:hypothetical protein